MRSSGLWYRAFGIAGRATARKAWNRFAGLLNEMAPGDEPGALSFANPPLLATGRSDQYERDVDLVVVDPDEPVFVVEVRLAR